LDCSSPGTGPNTSTCAIKKDLAQSGLSGGELEINDAPKPGL